MQRSSYTCRRCLASLQQGVQVSIGSRLTIRWSSSSKVQTGKLHTREVAGAHRPAPRAIARRGASSFVAQERSRGDGADDSFHITSLGHATPETDRVLLQPDNLFHPFTRSPAPDIRQRAAYMKQHAYCPHPSHRRTRQPTDPDDLENRKSESPAAAAAAHVDFECPDCGIPVACCEEHWQDDYEAHLEVCDTLRQINEDDHDLRSGRFFPEYEYPGPQRAEEFVINMSNWDTFLYTRDFAAIDDDRSMRQATRLLTYPITVASVLNELSPYNIKKGGRMTPEGLRSFSALRYTLHPPRQGFGDTVAGLRPSAPPVRIFVLGARAESSLPRDVWAQITHCFPRAKFHVVFIGPEAMANREREFPLPERTSANPFGGVVEDRVSPGMKMTTYVDFFHTMHEAGQFAPYDPYFDVFVLFHPGLGHPASSHDWEATVPMLLDTKCPIICTGYTEWDMERDRAWVQQRVGGELDMLLEPGENIFRSLRWDLNDLDPVDVSCGNWGLWAFRGKRYEATNRETGE